MSQFDPAFAYLMQFEDAAHTWALAKDNNDAGVIAGINAASWPSQFAAIAQTAQPLREQAVRTFYLQNFWNPFLLGGLESQDLASRVLDMAVNSGPATGVKLLQEAICALRAGSVSCDGSMGPETLHAANLRDPEALLAAYRTVRKAYYENIAAAHPADAPYLAGWLRRAEA